MCVKNGFTFLLLFLVFGLSFPCLSYSEEVTANSPPTSQPPNTLWDELLSQTSSLPENFDNFVATLEMRIGLLRDSNESLQKTNDDLTTNNESLTESLTQSEIKAATSEAKSGQLQKDLDASTLSITQAQKEADRLENRARFWSFIGKLSLLVAAGEGAYIAVNHFF